MLDFTYENQGVNTYLVYKVKEDDVLDNMSLGMLTNNKIPGLSPALFTQMNDDKLIKYNISSRISAKQLLWGTVNRKRLLSVFIGIADTMLALDDYLIDVNLVLLNLDYIFVDPSTYEVNMICLPVTNTSGAVSLYDFVKNIMFSTQFEQSENCDYVTKIINFLNATTAFSINSFKQLLDSLIEDVASVETGTSPTKTTVIPVVNIVEDEPETPVVKLVECHAEPVVSIPTKKESIAISPATNESATSISNISWFYLMQHYNAENAAAYKAQKAAKKQAGKKSAQTSKVKAKNVKNNDSINMGFAIPGQETPIAPMSVQSTPDMGIKEQPKIQKEHSVLEFASTPSYASVSSSATKLTTDSSKQILQLPDFDELDDDGTVFIGVNSQEHQLFPHLVRMKNCEIIPISKPMFKIGRNSELNDYNITENKFVGHCHCHIIKRDTDFYIVDDNTKNHTYVDGQMITGSIEVQISDGCIIRLADEEFEFKLY